MSAVPITVVAMLLALASSAAASAFLHKGGAAERRECARGTVTIPGASPAPGRPGTVMAAAAAGIGGWPPMGGDRTCF